MGCPCLSQRRRLCKAGGGGSDDQPLQYRRSMIQGSSHPRTERLAIGQDTCGRLAAEAGTSGRSSALDGFCSSSVGLAAGWLA